MRFKQTKGIFSLLLCVCLVLSLLPLTASAVTPVGTPSALIAALEASTADTITVTADIALTDPVTVGASHTMNVSNGVTLTIGSPSAGNYTMMVPLDTTLTVTGEGVLKVANSAEMGILIMGGMTVAGGNLTVENSGANVSGIVAPGPLTVENGSTLQAKNTGNNIGISSINTITIEGSTATIASTNSSMSECNGIRAENLVIDNSTVQITCSANTAGLTTISGGSISLINGSTVTTQGSSGTGISFNMSSGLLRLITPRWISSPAWGLIYKQIRPSPVLAAARLNWPRARKYTV